MMLDKEVILASTNAMTNGVGYWTFRGILSTEKCAELLAIIQSFEADAYGSVRCLLDKSPIFEEIIMCDEINDVCRELFRTDCRLSAFGARVIDPRSTNSEMHRHIQRAHIDHPYREIIATTEGKSCPLYGIPLGTQVLIPLVDLTEDMGATACVPGSQKWYRHPSENEFEEHRKVGDVTRITMAAGDMTMWSGPLWHRAMPNLTQNTRAMLTFLFSPPYMKHPHLMRDQYSDEYFRKCPERVKQLVSWDDDYPAVYPPPSVRGAITC